MHNLVNLRFLDSYIDDASYRFPSSIELFWNLQTLIVQGHEVVAPAYIWCMPHIRHIEFPELHLLDPPDSQDEIVLENLQTFVGIMNFKCSEQVVKRIPNIKKLEISYGDGRVDDKYCLSNLVCLDKLESLTCSFYEEMNLTEPAYDLQRLPHSLKKLSLLFDGDQCWEEILDEIGALPLLEKLQLRSGRFGENKWETSEGQFPRLKFLRLSEFHDLRHWIAESSHFPCLEHLVLAGASNLKEIPLDFAKIPTLGRIDVEYCGVSVVESAKRISEEQEELYGEVSLQVRVMLLR